jgi:hypothetical protein
LFPSIGIALQQLLQLNGAFIFGQVVNYHNVATFVNFGLLIAGIVALILIISQSARDYRKKSGLTKDYNFVLVTMAISFFVVFFVYALSGYAITTSSTGQVISDNNARYISLMPLISVIGVVWLLKKYYQKHIVLIFGLCLVLVLGIATSYSAIGSTYGSRADQLELAPSRATINSIDSILEANDVTKISADYWYGPVIGFWTNDSINLAQEVGCNQNTIANSGAPFTAQKGVNTALIVDRGGLNYDFWTCTDAQLKQYYGTPTQTYYVPGAAPNTTVEVWVYHNGGQQ